MRVESLWAPVQGKPEFMRKVNGWLTIFWRVMILVFIVTGWLKSLILVCVLIMGFGVGSLVDIAGGARRSRSARGTPRMVHTSHCRRGGKRACFQHHRRTRRNCQLTGVEKGKAGAHQTPDDQPLHPPGLPTHCGRADHIQDRELNRRGSTRSI